MDTPDKPRLVLVSSLPSSQSEKSSNLLEDRLKAILATNHDNIDSIVTIISYKNDRLQLASVTNDPEKDRLSSAALISLLCIGQHIVMTDLTTPE